MHKKFYSSHLLLSLLPVVKMNANCAEMCRVGNLEADFQQVLFVQFYEIYTVLL